MHPQFTSVDIDRYLRKIDRTGECWPWLGKPNHAGYGRINIGGTIYLAHRFGYETLIGPIPDGLCVCHRCDNPPCQRPSHWFLGTHAENMADQQAKGRNNQRGRGRMSIETVRAIRGMKPLGYTNIAIAQKLGITKGAVWHVVHGMGWHRDVT